ncbi:MAG: UDP-N-acetylmuramoyl-L-alanyl-D-glutamate--2,6-diaminopimelate ligase [Candidatus Adiutrix sp.]
MVKLSALAKELGLHFQGPNDPEITAISEDSHLIEPGAIFVALKGANLQGQDFILEARNKGASAIILEEGSETPLSAPHLLAPKGEIRAIISQAAAHIYDHPAEKICTLAITGTNGKTTTSYLVESILKQTPLSPAVLGTINFRWPGHCEAAPNTTPEGPFLQKCLHEIHKSGAKAAIMEVSSHALALGRVSGLKFDGALFTNLSRDHLDFHCDMEDYYEAKKKLFTHHLKNGAPAIINIDDEYGLRLNEELGQNSSFKIITFGLNPKAMIRGANLSVSRTGLALDIHGPNGHWHQTSPLLGEVGAYNLLAAASLALALNIEPTVIEGALKGALGAPGRMEAVGSLEGRNLVLIDYAHSPDALAKALMGAAGLEPKRLIVVFGCGGDRDKGKRPIMGNLAGKGAHLTIITSDNPRTEEPWAIMNDIEAGLTELNLTKFQAGELVPEDWSEKAYLMIMDRRAAINEAIRLMNNDDIVLIAGKGHENYQIIGREKRFFDDSQEAALALQKRK